MFFKKDTTTSHSGYQPDHRDKVVAIDSVPQSSIGAPIPLVISDENTLLLAYCLEGTEPLDGQEVRVVGPSTEGECIALVKFERFQIYSFGSPNDEAFSGHPLAERGLKAYGCYEIKNSSWVRNLEKLNRVHPNHSKSLFDDLKHYIFSFHDTTLEIVCTGFDYSIMSGNMRTASKKMLTMMDWE